MVSPNNNSSGGSGFTSPNSQEINIEMPTLSLKLASDLISEMDNLIKADLAMLEKFYTTDYKDVPFERAINKAKRKYEKRRGPTLIKPLNKTKKRMIVGDMEYDPKTQSWRGNESDLAGFPNLPALITNMGKADERVLGSMKWDPNQKEWKGNERDLTKFRFLKPALISQLTPSESRVENGMVYNPKTMRWEGNEDALDVFETMDEQNNDMTFSVGKEFNLTPQLTSSFRNSAEQHNKTLSGWFSHRDIQDKDYLFSIRSMSIMKIVRAAAFKGGLSPNSSSNSMMASGIGMGSPGGGIISLIPNKKKPVVDETKDWDDIDFEEEKPALKLNLKIHLDAEDEMNECWDKGFTSEEETLSSNNEAGGQFSSSSQPHTPRKQPVEEWSDFDNTMNSTITGKIIQLNKKENSNSSLNNTSNGSLGNLLGGSNKFDDDDDDFDWSGNNGNTLNSLNNTANSSGSMSGSGLITNLSSKIKKGGSLKGGVIGSGSTRSKKGGDKSKRGGTFNIQSFASALSGGNANTPLSSSGSTIAGSGNVNEFYDEFQIPSGGVSLKNKLHQDNFDLFDSDASNNQTLSKDEPCDETMKFFGDEKEVFEEDWPDVHLPVDFGAKKNQESRKSPTIRNNQIEDYSDELDIPQLNQPLKLKSHHLIDNPFDDDDLDLGDEKDTWDDISFPENPSQLISSTSKLQKSLPINKSHNLLDQISFMGNQLNDHIKQQLASYMNIQQNAYDGDEDNNIYNKNNNKDNINNNHNSINSFKTNNNNNNNMEEQKLLNILLWNTIGNKDFTKQTNFLNKAITGFGFDMYITQEEGYTTEEKYLEFLDLDIHKYSVIFPLKDKNQLSIIYNKDKLSIDLDGHKDTQSLINQSTSKNSVNYRTSFPMDGKSKVQIVHFKTNGSNEIICVINFHSVHNQYSIQEKINYILDFFKFVNWYTSVINHHQFRTLVAGDFDLDLIKEDMVQLVNDEIGLKLSMPSPVNSNSSKIKSFFFTINKNPLKTSQISYILPIRLEEYYQGSPSEKDNDASNDPQICFIDIAPASTITTTTTTTATATATATTTIPATISTTTTTTTKTNNNNNINNINNKITQTPNLKNIKTINETPSKYHTPITFRPLYTPKTIDEILKTPESPVSPFKQPKK